MDPFSVTVGVISVTAATAETCTALLGLMHNAANSSEELRNISRDIQAFYQVVFSIALAVKEDKLPSVLRNDEAMISMIENLQDPLRNCQVILGQLMVKVEPYVAGKPSAHKSIVWNLKTKKEVGNLLAQLSQTKSTLNGAFTSLST